MKLQDSGIKTHSTVQGLDIKMKMADEASIHLMGILTELYSDPIMAVIREYLTNALDAHIQQGINKPVEASTPTSLKPVFTVRDYGVGLDANDIEYIYSLYGKSTKTDSNDVVGMLGLGCKSALAYSDQFTLTGIKNGILTQVIVSRNDEGQGVMTIAHEGPTDEASGVIVSVPSKTSDIDHWLRKSKEFLQYWKPGQVLLDGKQPDFLPNSLKVTDDFYIIDSNSPTSYSSVGNDVVVMGNVPYPTKLGFVNTYKKAVVAFVPIGSVQFTPSREGLQDTPKTKKALDDLKDQFEKAKKDVVEKKLKEATSKAEVIETVYKLKNSLSINFNEPIRFKGEEIPLSIPVDCHVPSTRDYWGEKGKWHERNSVSLEELASSIWVTDFHNSTWNVGMKDKLKRYCEVEHGIVPADNNQFILIKSPRPPYKAWIPKPIISWKNQVRNWKDPEVVKAKKANPKANIPPGTYYEGYTPDNIFVSDITPEKLINSNDLVVYSQNVSRNIVDKLKDSYGKKAWVVRVPSNRENKFKRLVPKAELVHKKVYELGQAWWKKQSEEEKLAVAFYDHLSRMSNKFLADLDSSKIDDPQLAKLVQRVSLVSKVTPSTRKKYVDAGTPTITDSGINYTEFLKKEYPFISIAVGGYMSNHIAPEHVYVYVNAIHKNKSEDK